MKKFLLALLICTVPVIAQQQTSNLPHLEKNEKVTFKSSIVEQTATASVAVPAAMDTTKNLDTLILSKDLIHRGEILVANMQFAKSTDSLKFQQYNYQTSTWENLPVTYKKRNATLASGQGLAVGADTTASGGWLSPVGTNLNIGVRFDFQIPNRYNSDIRICRGVQDTGTAQIGYIEHSSRAPNSVWKWRP